MNAVELLRNRIVGTGEGVRGVIAQTAALDWSAPLLPGTSPLGLTLWHLPRTVDWLISTSIRGVTEVADDPAFADLPNPDVYGFGTGLAPEIAVEAAAKVRPRTLLPYVDAVYAMADEWLGTLKDKDLDQPVEGFDDRQRARPSYCTEAAMAEVAGLGQVPLGILLTRPALAHLARHMGEVDLIAQLAEKV